VVGLLIVICGVGDGVEVDGGVNGVDDGFMEIGFFTFKNGVVTILFDCVFVQLFENIGGVDKMVVGDLFVEFGDPRFEEKLVELVGMIK